MTVVGFDGIHSFTSTPTYWGSARTWTNRYKDGATINDDGDHVTLITKSGDQVVYSHIDPNGNGIGCGGGCAVALYAKFSSGEIIIFSYDTIITSPVSSDLFFYPTHTPIAWSTSRLTSVVNSRGYGLRFEYVNPSLTTGEMQTRTLISDITGYRARCTNGVVSCASGSLPQVSYGYTAVYTDASSGNSVYRLTSFKQSDGNIIYYEYNGPEFRVSKAYRPGNTTSIVFENTYSSAGADIPSNYAGIVVYPYSGRIVTQKDGLQNTVSFSTSYNSFRPNAASTTTANYPGGYSYSAYFPGNREMKNPLPAQVDLPLGRQLFYTYDEYFRLTNKINAEGDSESYLLDDRGNVKELTHSPKTNEAETPIVERWSFPLCTSYNFRVCNKPDYYLDGKLNRTDYQYDVNHGGILVTLSPANIENKRAVSAFSYSPFYPASSIDETSEATLSPTYLLVTKDTCVDSTVNGMTVDFNYVCPANVRSRTEFVYTESSLTMRTSHELERIVNSTNSAAYQTCFHYDVVGNKIAEFKPRANMPCS